MESVLIMDIVKSRGYDTGKRQLIQNVIEEAARRMNDVFREAFVDEISKIGSQRRYGFGTPGKLEMDFSAGDELQGLFKTPMEAYLYYRLFTMLVSPVKLRGGIGVGSWTVRTRERGTAAQDGQVYHLARQAIDDAEEQDGYGLLYRSCGNMDTVINSLINAAGTVCPIRKASQKGLILRAELLGPLLGDGMDAKKLLSLWEMNEELEKINYYAMIEGKTLAYAGEFAVHPANAPDFEPVPIHYETDSGYFTTVGKQRGLPKRLSDLTGKSRQSVDKGLKTSHFYEARNIAVSALKAMKTSFEQEG